MDCYTQYEYWYVVMGLYCTYPSTDKGIQNREPDKENFWKLHPDTFQKLWRLREQQRLPPEASFFFFASCRDSSRFSLFLSMVDSAYLPRANSLYGRCSFSLGRDIINAIVDPNFSLPWRIVSYCGRGSPLRNSQ